MKVDFYSVNMKPGEVTLGKDIPQQDITAGTTIETRVDKSGVLSASETVMFPTVNVGEAGNEKPLICYVKKVEGMMTELIPVGTATIPAIAKGTRIVRMGARPTSSTCRRRNIPHFPPSASTTARSSRLRWKSRCTSA